MIHPACQYCAGACCETVVIDQARLCAEDVRWLALHGRALEHAVELPCRCRALRTDGLCGDYEERPYTCRVYEVGGHACLDAVLRRRGPRMVDEITKLVEKGRA